MIKIILFLVAYFSISMVQFWSLSVKMSLVDSSNVKLQINFWSYLAFKTISDIKVILMSFVEANKKVSITWQGVHAYAKDKAILTNCQGYCQPGEMLAIMGPSGAGKTSLLSLLSKRNNPALKIEGNIFANTQEFNQKTFYTFGAFVYQSDLLQQTLTVRQTLEFAANLKIPSRQQAAQKVQKLLAELQLQKCQNAFVGGKVVKGISGGEKKRVCIAIEMVSKPSVIILDEPTSGLDSNKASKVLGILKKLANHGHTIIFTLHQPSYLQYIKLDRLILLNRGYTVYQGLASNAEKYLASLNIKVNLTATISDFFMMQISESKRLAEDYQTPLNYDNYLLRLKGQISTKINKINNQANDLHFQDVYMASFAFSLLMLMKRDWTTFWRDVMKFRAIIFNTIMRFILIGFLYMDFIKPREVVALDPITSFRVIQGIAFNCTASTVFTSLFAVALTIPAERQLFYKETDSKKYSILPYLLSKMIIMNLGTFVGSIIFCLTAYWLNGWTKQFDYFANFTLIILILTFVGCGLGFFCAGLFKQIERVSSLTNLIMIPMLILAGLFVKLSSMPVWTRWMQYISPFRYGFQMFVQNEFRDQIFGTYNYKVDLGYSLSYGENMLILVSLGLSLYIFTFLLLKYNPDSMVA